MILSYIQDWVQKETEKPRNTETITYSFSSPDMSQELTVIQKHSINTTEENPKENLSDNSFESKYLQFKDRIEKDRMAWEILANRNK